VNRVGNQFLAGAVFSLDQDVGIARRNALDELEEILHLLALADDVRKAVLAADLLLELLVLGALLRAIDGLPDHVHQAVLADGLLQEVKRARLPRFHRASDRAVSADDDDLRPGIELFEPAQQCDAVEVGEHQVGDDHVGPPLLEDFFSARTDECGPHLVPVGLDDHLQPLGHRRFIVDRKDAAAALGHGRGSGHRRV
jgi:hypothetical protein